MAMFALNSGKLLRLINVAANDKAASNYSISLNKNRSKRWNDDHTKYVFSQTIVEHYLYCLQLYLCLMQKQQ